MATDHAQIAAAQTDDARSVAELITAYREGPALLRSSLEGMDRAQLLARPVPGMMCTLEVVCHIADAEQYLADRMKRTVAMDRPLLIGVDGWRYPQALSYAERDLELDLALVASTRAQMTADLQRLHPQTWERTAVHSETGLVTLRGLLLHAIRHLEAHVQRIHEKRIVLGLE